MSTHDMNIANQGFPAFRADLNNALAALVSNSSSATEPTTTFAYQFWADTGNDLLKQRNAANDGWVDLLVLSTGAPVGVQADKISEGNSYIEVIDSGTGYAVIVIDGVERARVDGSGNLLVGKTSSNINTQGVELLSDGRLFGTANGDKAIDLNRLNGDGDIIKLRKDGGTVGSIGARAGYVTIGKGDVGLLFQDANNRIEPNNQDGLTGSDGVIDLGSSTTRFKDLYLSGGVYVGGTGAANYLDDYEEGTWTPTVYGASTAGTATYGSRDGTYTKIGNTVHIRMKVTWSAHSGSGQIKVSGLPFAQSSSRATFSSIVESCTFSGTPKVMMDDGGSSTFGLFQEISNSGLGGVNMDSQVTYWLVTGSYQVA